MRTGNSGLWIIVSVSAVLAVSPLLAHAADDDVQALQSRIDALTRRYEQQAHELQQMHQRLQSLQVDLRDIRGRGAPDNNAYKQQTQQEQGVPDERPDARQTAARSTAGQAQPAPAGNAQNQTDTQQGGHVSGTVGQKPEPSRSAQAVQEQAQGTVFTQQFTLEPSFTYTHSDRRQITLSGLLVLPAILLGNISLDKVRADTFQFDLTGRWGVTPRLQFFLDVPALYRGTEYASAGKAQTGDNFSHGHAHGGPRLGDISLGTYYQIWKEERHRPSVVANLALTVPTGLAPYGIKWRSPDSSNSGFRMPDELPTGNGVYSVLAGLSVMKTVDPVILFANAGYRHSFKRDFDDISSLPGKTQAAEVDLGDSWQWGAGLALAVNSKMAMSFAFSQLITDTARVRNRGESWRRINASSANSAQVNLGLTYALTDKTTMTTTVGIGLTDDAPDYQLNVKFPYTF